MHLPSQEGTSTSAEPEFWLFGYGSLIWKPPPHFDKRIPGWVEGYVRRFWQASEDHRGTPAVPGRVATLITHEYWASLVDPHHGPAPDRVWGTAYRIPSAHVAAVREYLDLREINGYSIHYTPFHPAPSVLEKAQQTTTMCTTNTTTADASTKTTSPITCLVYIGTPENPQFVGPQDPQRLAEHIAASVGPSGPNRDYLLMLERALDELCPESEDAHIKDLANRVRALDTK